MCKGQVVKLMGPLCRAGSTLSLSFSLFDHSLGQSISVSQSAFSFLSRPKLFPTVSIYLHLISSCLTSPLFHPAIQFVLYHFFSLLLGLLVFFSLSLSLSFSLSLFFLSASVCRFFYLFSPSLQQSVREERTDLFKISKDRSGGLAGPSLSANSPSLLLTDKQKSEPAGLAAVYCLPSLLYPSLFSSCGGVDC